MGGTPKIEREALSVLFFLLLLFIWYYHFPLLTKSPNEASTVDLSAEVQHFFLLEWKSSASPKEQLSL